MATATLVITDRYAQYLTDLTASHTVKLVLGQLSAGVSAMTITAGRGAYAGAGSETGELATAFGYTQGGITVIADASSIAGASGSTLAAIYDSGTITLTASGGTITIGGAMLVDTSVTTGLGSPGGLPIACLDCANGGLGLVITDTQTFQWVPPTPIDQTSGMLRVKPNA